MKAYVLARMDANEFGNGAQRHIHSLSAVQQPEIPDMDRGAYGRSSVPKRSTDLLYVDEIVHVVDRAKRDSVGREMLPHGPGQYENSIKSLEDPQANLREQGGKYPAVRQEKLVAKDLPDGADANHAGKA